MSYTWDIDKLHRKLVLSRLLHNKKHLKYYYLVLNSLNINEEDFDKSELLLHENASGIDFMEAYKYFVTGLDYIHDDLYNDAVDIFSWFEDTASLRVVPPLSKLDMSDDDLVAISHDIIKSMGDPDLLKAFNVLINKDNHLLNIASSNENTKTATKSLGGVTFFHPTKRTSHINIFRENTVEDIEYLVHESLHFAYKYLLHKMYNFDGVHLFSELEGEFANVYVAEYLEKIGFKDGSYLREMLVNNCLTASYLLMINHILFKTAKNKQFDVSSATQEVNKYLENIEIDILESEVPSYLTISAFEEVTNILSYLTALELNKDYSPNDALSVITSLKMNESADLYANLEENGIHFIKDGYKDLIKEYKITHKK